LWRDLLNAVDGSIENLINCDISIKKTQNYIDLLMQLRPLIREKRLIWSQWVKLGKEEPAKKLIHLRKNKRARIYKFLEIKYIKD